MLFRCELHLVNGTSHSAVKLDHVHCFRRTFLVLDSFEVDLPVALHDAVPLLVGNRLVFLHHEFVELFQLLFVFFGVPGVIEGVIVVVRVVRLACLLGFWSCVF
jgi:hypothetical protein